MIPAVWHQCIYTQLLCNPVLRKTNFIAALFRLFVARVKKMWTLNEKRYLCIYNIFTRIRQYIRAVETLAFKWKQKRLIIYCRIYNNNNRRLFESRSSLSNEFIFQILIEQNYKVSTPLTVVKETEIFWLI